MFHAKTQKAVLVGAIGLYMAMVALGNATDPDANFAFVQHVLTMDTVPAASKQKWRAVTNPEMWRLVYVLILVYQTVVAGWLVWAAARLARATEGSWKQAREFASGALVTTLLLWLVAFIIVGGEWFQMWQSNEWNGISAAARNFTVQALVLLYLQTPND
jgi:predicted small integral membrane protein